jgi:acyl-homoserine lactone acylase PvdQ
MRRLPVAILLALALAAPAYAKDYAAPNGAYSILNPGQSGNLPTDLNSVDQADMYDALTPKLGNVTAADLKRTFKPNVFGIRGQRPAHREKTTNDRVRILVDRWGVPHIKAKRRRDVMFGAGWMIAKERNLLLELARPLARLTVLDPPGINAFGLVTTLRQFEPTAQADEIVDREQRLLERSKKGREILKDMKAYLRGLNAEYRDAGRDVPRWTMTDFIAATGFIGSIFGRGGGDEARRSLFLDALRDRLGATQGTAAWNDLRNFSDPEAPVSISKGASWGTVPDQAPGSVVLDDGSFEPIEYGPPAATSAATPDPPDMSTALLVSGRRSKSGHPLFVAGPQLGTFYPALVYEMDMHGGGIDARGASIPGTGPYVFIGRNQDFAWSLTSANNDIIDAFAETLCDGSDTKYMYKGECRDMTAIDAGVLKGNGTDVPDQRLAWNETVHGPVIGYGTVNGQRVALARKRSTQGREVMSIRLFHDLNSNKVKTGKQFLKAANQLEHTFNAFYADEQEIAMFSTCRCPDRADGVDPGLPTIGTGSYEWEGFLRGKRHPQQVKRRGVILNWNNKPAPGWGAADSEWNFGSVFRVQLFKQPIAERRKHTLASVVGAMNEAATRDHRAAVVLDAPIRVLDTAAAPSPRAAQMLAILKDWRANGSVRIDADRDGFDDHAGAAILDAWWPRLANAVMSPVLGGLVDRLALLNSIGRAPDGTGNQSTAGWAGYVDKDLRTLLGDEVDGPYNVHYCGAGVLAACAQDLWASLDAAGAELEAEQGTADPNAWRKSTEIERIKYLPELIDKRIEFTNRSTFQQAITFPDGRGD